MSQNKFFVVPAPGYYGDVATVYSGHRTLEAAKRASRPGSGTVIRQGDMSKGDRWLRVYEETYPAVDR